MLTFSFIPFECSRTSWTCEFRFTQRPASKASAELIQLIEFHLSMVIEVGIVDVYRVFVYVKILLFDECFIPLSRVSVAILVQSACLFDIHLRMLFD